MKWIFGVAMGVLLAAGASAQSSGGQSFDKTVTPLKVFFGLFVPNSGFGGGASTRNGFTLGFGYKAWENETGMVEFETRGTFFQVSQGGNDKTLAQVSLYMNFNLKASKDVYVGFGPGFTTGRVTVSGNDFGTKGDVAFHGYLGFNFNPTTFGQIRLNGGARGSAGWSAEVGFRF